MGLKKCHGLRHAYAQRHYHELTKALDPRKKDYYVLEQEENTLRI